VHAAREGRETLRRQREQVVSAIDRGREAFDKARRGEEPA